MFDVVDVLGFVGLLDSFGLGSVYIGVGIWFGEYYG